MSSFSRLTKKGKWVERVIRIEGSGGIKRDGIRDKAYKSRMISFLTGLGGKERLERHWECRGEQCEGLKGVA